MLSTLAHYFSFSFVRYAFIVGILISLCSSLLGVTLVLKRFSFIGDGLSHVAFGAICIAAVFNLSNNMFLVLPVTIICAIILLRTGKNAKLQGDAAIAMLSVASLAIGYLIMNIFSTSANLTGDVCSTLFGSTSILTLKKSEVWLCAVLSIAVIIAYIIFYNKIFAVTFDENFAQAIGTHAQAYNLVIAIITAVIIVLAMNLVGSLLISALVIFPALSAMRLFKSFKSVTIASAVISVVCSTAGLLISVLAGTPVGSTIVAADLAVFLICVLINSVNNVFNHKTLLSKSTLNLVFMLIVTAGLFVSCGKEKQSHPKEQTTESKVDMDLTKMSATMIYSTVFDMLIMPDEYENKVIKVKGNFQVFTNENNGQQYYAIIIPDATACCKQGIEFIWDGEHKYPEDYPELETEITITGAYQIIENEEGITYSYLKVSALEV